MAQDYDRTVAQLAATLMSGAAVKEWYGPASTIEDITRGCVRLAREIVAEVQRTEPKPVSGGGGQHVRAGAGGPNALNDCKPE